MARGTLVGLDIGSSVVKVCVLKETKRNLQLKTFDMVTLPPDAIVDGVVMNNNAVVEAIRGLMSRNRIKQKNCAISVSGYSVIVNRISLPLMTEQELESSFQWEVEHHIPFDINDVYIDKQILTKNPEVGTMDVLLVASKRDTVNEYLDVTRDAGLTPKVVDVDCFCLQNMFEVTYPDIAQEPGTTALIDIGAATSSIIIMTDGITAFTRDLSMGGGQFTEEIQKQLQITREEAEAYKTGGGDLEADAIIPGEVEEVIQRVSNTIAQELQRSLNFFLENSGAEFIDRLILTGGTAKTPILPQVISDVTQIPTEVGNPFASLQYDPKVYNPDFLDSVAPSAAIAVGLALRRANE